MAKNPIKGGNKDNLGDYKTDSGLGKNALKKGGKWIQNAELGDHPTISDRPNSMKEFEITAIVLEGKDKGKYYGSVKWGWERDAAGTLKQIPFDLVSKGVPSKNFMETAKKWNAGKTKGSFVINKDDVPLKWAPKTGQLMKGDEVRLIDKTQKEGISYLKVEILSGAHMGSIGSVKEAYIDDSGSGIDTVDLPIVATKIPTASNVILYENKDKTTETKKLDLLTRMKIIEEDNEMAKIEIVDGHDITLIGWVEKSFLKDE